MEDLKKDQNELNDILIKREGAQGGKLKNVLLMTAALLLIVIIGVLTYRIIDSNAGDVQREASSEMPPAMPAEEAATPEEAAQPPADEADAQRQRLDELIARHREAREKEQSAAQAEPESPAQEEAKEPAERQADTRVPEQTQTQTPPPPPEPQAAPKPAKAQTEEVPAPKPAPKPAQASEEPTTQSAAAGSFFVQVESLTRDPREAYLKDLKESGYEVVVRERTVDGRAIKRIYIGPYGSKEEAAAILPKIRKELNPEAFIIQD
jgi:cell division septation protein DedD